MKEDVILAGVGGQGLLLLAEVIGQAALASGLHLKQAEVHGMAQRGGSVTSHLRFSDRPIYSDLVPDGEADLVLSLEVLEGLRYAHLLSASGVLVTSTASVRNMPGYPDEAAILAAVRRLPAAVVVDAPRLAEAAGSPQAANVVVLGAAVPFLGLREERIVEALRQALAAKSQAVLDADLRALHLGLKVQAADRPAA